MSLALRHLYKFDSFVVDVNERVLFRDGRMVPLTPKVFETLLLLVKNQGSIVTKETMLSTLWPDVFVEESNVTFNITKLRKALGDTKQSSVYIETVPRRGYRFKTHVSEVLGEDTIREADLSEVVTHRGNGQLEAIPATGEQQQTLPRPTLSQVTPNGLLNSPRTLSLIKRKRVVLLLAGLAAVVVLMAGATLWRFNRQTVHAGKGQSKAIVGMPLTPGGLKIEQLTTYGNIGAAVISPDGKQIAYVEENNGQQSLWLKQMPTAVNVRIISPGYAVFNEIAFSHDSNYIYFVQHRESEFSNLYRVPALGGPPTKLHENVEGSFSLSPDDSKVAFRRRDRVAKEDTLYIADLNDGHERALIKHQAPNWIFAFAWSPDGKAIIFATGETDSMQRTMVISEVNVETGQEKYLIKPNWYFIKQFAWLPDGKGLLICAKENLSAEIWQMSYPGLQLQKVTDDLNYYLSISLSADAARMVALQSKLVSQVWVSPLLDVSHARNIGGGRGKLAWMPDGRIVYDSGTRIGSDLWIAKPDGTEPKQLISKSGFNNWPAVSPDGRTIVFQSDRTGVQHLWRMDSDGRNQTQLTKGQGDRNAAFSPDGKSVYYNSAADFSLWKIGLDGSPAVKLTDDYSAYPLVSPDGKLIAAFRFPKYGHEAAITIRRIDDLKVVSELSLARGFWISRTIQWEPDSAAVIYAIEEQGKVKLYRQPLNQQPPRLLTSLEAEDEFEFAISAKKRLAFTSTKWDHDIVSISGLK
jgi:Tol biopolymer transport system component/DNA-binding winged helix-turn-helix (wHTH) protein